MSKIEEVTDLIVKALDSQKWSTADRLTDVLKQLVKLEIAAIEGKKNHAN